jgi:toxin ParE1/3/4
MQVRWTLAASSDLESIAHYLFEKTPEHAPRLIRELYNAAAKLTRFPDRGRPGKKKGTRELVLRGSPYIVVYKISGQALFIVRVLHGSQDWQG